MPWTTSTALPSFSHDQHHKTDAAKWKGVEYLLVRLTVGNERLLVLGIYQPGSQASSSMFFDELSSALEQVSLCRCPIVVTGNLNVHVDNHNDPHALRLAQLLQSFFCVQHIDEQTHRDGHTLDLVITRRDTTVRVGDWLSDHALISVELDIRKPRQEHVETTSRRWSLDKPQMH